MSDSFFDAYITFPLGDDYSIETLLARNTEEIPDSKLTPKFAPSNTTAASPFDISSGTNSTRSSLSPGAQSSEDDSDSDSDSVSSLDNPKFNTNAYFSDYNMTNYIHNGRIEDEAPYMPPSLSDTTEPLRLNFKRRSFLAYSLPIIARSSPNQKPYSSVDADADWDRDAGGESEGNATDDEYIPPSYLKDKKRGRSPSPTPSQVIPSASTYIGLARPIKRPRTAPVSRNSQASSALSATIRRVVNSKSGDMTNYICPQCGWHQRNRRMPDFKRHLKTHTRPGEEEEGSGWRCRGILLEDAHKFYIPPGSEPYTFLDKQRIGGCMRTFSRRDALKRHLDNKNVSCIGRPSDPTDD